MALWGMLPETHVVPPGGYSIESSFDSRLEVNPGRGNCSNVLPILASRATRGIFGKLAAFGRKDVPTVHG